MYKILLQKKIYIKFLTRNPMRAINNCVKLIFEAKINLN